MATSPGQQESGNTSSHPNCTPPPPPPKKMTVKQQLQSMAAVMAELTQRNQELTKEVNRQCQNHGGEWGQNSGNEGAENNAKRDSLGVPLLVGYHIWRERWTKWKESWKTWRILWGEQIMWITSSTGLIFPLLRPSQIIPSLPSLKCLPWIHMMGRWPLRSYCHFQNNHASSRCSIRNYVQSLSYHLERSSLNVV